MSDSQFRCEQCSKVFANRRNLLQHVRRNHRPNCQLFRCEHCKFESKFKITLQRHIVGHSKSQKPVREKKLHICLLCRLFKCEERNEMMEHYEKVHEVPLTERIVSFENIQDFKKWKTGIERADVCRFAIYSAKERKFVDMRYYRCCHDGIYDPKGNGKRRLKSQGSIRIGGICPASMKVVTEKETGVVQVTFIPNHVGHTKEVGRLNLIKEERAEIADDLAQQIPYQPGVASGEAANESTVEPAKDSDYSNDLITPDDVDSMERVIITEISKKCALEVPKNNIDNKIQKIREKVDEILECLQTDEHADIVWNALLPVIPTIKASSSTEHPNFVPASGQVKKLNVLQKMSPQKHFYSTKARRAKPQNSLLKPTDKEKRVTAAAFLTNFKESQKM